MTNLDNNIFEENSNNYFLQVIESLPLGILLFDARGKITFLNNNFLEICEYHKVEINSSAAINIFNENLFPENNLLEHFKRLSEGYSFEKEIDSTKTFGLRKIVVVVKAIPLFKEEIFDGGIVILQDIKIGKEADDELKNIDTKWREILNTAVDFLLITDSNGNIKFSFGRRSKKFLSRISPFEQSNINSLFSEETNKLIQEKLKIVREIQSSLKFELQLPINNKFVEFECEAEPILNDDKSIKLLFFKFTDIRNFTRVKKEFEQKILELTKQTAYLEKSIAPIFVVDITGKIIYWNEASKVCFGFSEEQVKDKTFTALLKIAEPDYFDKIKQQLIKSNHAEGFFKIIKSAEAEEVVKATYKLVKDKDEFIIVSCEKVTEKIKLENQIKTTNEILSKSNQLIFIIDDEGKIIFANNRFLSRFDLPQKYVSTKKISEFIDSSFLQKNSLKNILTNSESKKQIEIPFVTKNKSKIFLTGHFQKTAETKTKPNYIGYFEEVKLNKSIRGEITLLSELVKSAKDGIAVEMNGRLVLANDAFVKLFHYTRTEDLLGKSFIELIGDEDVTKISEYLHLLRRKIDAPDRFEYFGKHEKGLKSFYSTSVSAFDFEGKSCLLYLTRDITDRKLSQLSLKESEEKYRNLIENIDDFFFSYSKINNYLAPVFFTSGVQKITGYTQTELIRDQRLFFKIIHLDDLHIAKNKLNDILKSRIKNSTEIEYRIINRYGNIIWVRNKINLVRDEQNNVTKLYGIVSDISTKKKAEEDFKQSKEDLIKLNETKDRFLSIVSHDLRTPFSSILGFTDLILNDETLTDTEIKTYVKFIQESSNSMLALVNSLLDWNRLQSGRIQFEPVKTDAYSIISTAISSLSGAALRKKIQLTSLVPNDIQIFVDINLILQVFNNLISNAIKFTEMSGTITVSVKPSERLRFLEFSVKDNGVGINPEDMNKLFSIENKFTLPGTSGEKGSGMGLTIVHDIIRKHGGSIWVESEPGKGSDFKFALPVASSVILLVDDNKTDRLLYSKILKNVIPDYNVQIASNGREAIEIILKSPPALVITDHNMPEMDGIQLVQSIQKLDSKSKPPVIVLSGDLDRTIISSYDSLGIEFIFQKPVDVPYFKQAVERTIRKGLLGE